MLRIEVVPRQRAAVEVLVTGPLSIEHKDRFEKSLFGSLSDQDIEVIGINFHRVTSIDSSGIGVLIKTLNLCRQEGKRLVLHGISDTLLTVFKFARLENFFEFVRSDEFYEKYPSTKEV